MALSQGLAGSLAEIHRRYVNMGRTDLFLQDAIAPGSSYPEGTFGVVPGIAFAFALRDTDAVATTSQAELEAAGWEVVALDIPALVAEVVPLAAQVDVEQVLRVDAEQRPGFITVGWNAEHIECVEHVRLSVPVMLGPWKPGHFLPFDVVTHDECLWRAIAETDEPPGASDAWVPYRAAAHAA